MVIGDSDIIKNSINAIGTFINLSLVMLFLYLRIKGDKEPMTNSQRWALTLLTWLFIANSMSLLFMFVRLYFQDIGDLPHLYWADRVGQTIDVLVSIMLLAIGLVFPRPIMRWDRLQFVLAGLFLATFALIGLQLFVHRNTDQSYQLLYRVSNYTYMLGWFIPVLLWLPYYARETSPEVRTVMALFMWGFLSSALNSSMVRVFDIVLRLHPTSIWAVIMMTFFFYTMAYLVRILWSRRRSWGNAEWIHLIFIVFSLFNACTGVTVMKSRGIFVFEVFVFLCGNLPWVYLRPALFSYAILRYQIFGAQMRVERPLSLILGIAGALVTGVTIELTLFVTGSNIQTAIMAGAVAGLILFLPLWRFSGRIVARMLPLTSSEVKKGMREKRATYLMSLQTAVVDGEIDLEEDEKALMEQRHLLGISKREHHLLMDSFEAREKVITPKEAVDELFLILIDGRLIAHVGKSRGKGTPDADKDIVAGMLVAIKDYVQEGLTRQQTSLDSIKYGDYSLVIETEETMVLAAVARGSGSPELRQRMRDEMVSLKKMFGERLTKWDGDADKVRGVQAFLIEFRNNL